MSGSPKRYPPELRERAVRMVAEVRSQHPSEWAAIASVASKLGIGSAETLRNWIRKDQVDAGQRPGVTTDMAAEMRRLRAENRELKRANDGTECVVGSRFHIRLDMGGMGVCRVRDRRLCAPDRGLAHLDHNDHIPGPGRDRTRHLDPRP